ncbi:NADPH2:quinone reductase [Marinimicrobium koreense]|uniref:NADPH2:quinone reductase n=1 Tax=Marinimicrobium koreense TaxID=306545 RepID=A0A3N1NZZ0_9GAMM|nr:NAD(P)H-quinone oxidoreductase [Marinimicrobium koreense]ROQ20547.1 NADPH2:quinone reductase [Marinimicrobium koreense]
MPSVTPMRYVHYDAPGKPSVLTLAEGPAPEPRPDEVLIQVAAAGVNRPDVLQRQGLYPPPDDASPVLGLEVSGTVVAVGEGVQRWQLGDRVCALVNGGGYAEYAVAPADQCLPVPDGVALEDAAALPETLFTVWHNLWQRAGIQPGETLLVHGGASGIGTTAIQLAKALDQRVIVTAGSPEKCEACLALGADRAINYREEDFVTEVKAFTDGQGADVILDMVGGDYVQRNIKAAAKEGRIVNIAFLNGSKVEVDLMPLMLKRLTLTGSTLRAQSAEVKAGIARELEQRVWPLIALGRVRPLINHRFAISDTQKAHELMESNTLIGKAIINL